jgi:predicted O-linked N-acetylglucosamine transferase (SPINDLY family)
VAISSSASIQSTLLAAQAARDRADWTKAIALYRQAEESSPQSAEIKHNLGLAYLGLGQARQAIDCCLSALHLKPSLWQSTAIIAKAYRATQQMVLAQQYFQKMLGGPGEAQARIGLADLAMNEFGNPLGAIELIGSLNSDPEYRMDAQLTILMASLYDRPDWDKSGNAVAISNQIRQFSKEYLRLPDVEHKPFKNHEALYKNTSYRPRVGLLSPLFGVSPVYFLTIAGWRKIAQDCDVIVFNRGDQQDWATEEFKQIASQWVSVSHMPASHLAQRIRQEDLDVLYDLGGWMDAVALQALSTKPARKMFKWVGGQSVTTGLDYFDGWIGDEYQSPKRLQKLYSEPLIQIPGSYATYVPPPYMPKPLAWNKKSKIPCVFANPAKVSSPFLEALKAKIGSQGKEVVFIHRQYQYAAIQERIRTVLGNRAQFVFPKTHLEALQAVNGHQTMIDTFPYSGGLTAREAMALNTKVEVLRVGELFCERHTANLSFAKDRQG